MRKKKWFSNLINKIHSKLFKNEGYADSSFLLLGVALVLSIIMLVGTLTNDHESHSTTPTQNNDTIVIEQPMNLDMLDSVEDILYYEVLDNRLYVYTKKDSVQDEIDRWNYIRSLDPELWEE